MGAPAAKRPSRKGPAKRKKTAEPSMVDPETVERVRRMTAACMRTLEAVASTSGRACLDAIVAAAVWLGPRLRDGSLAILRALGRGIATVARWSWDRRGGLARIGQRGLWWVALGILVVVGQALLSADGDPELVELAVVYLSAGLSMSLLVMLSAPEARMRIAALALAGGHGSLAALALVAGANITV